MAGIRLTDYIPSDVNSAFFTDEFMTALEHHIPSLTNHPNTQLIQLSPGQANQYRNDFNGLLVSLGIPIRYHWAFLRCNGFTSPTEFTEEYLSIVQPPLSEIDTIQQIWLSNNRLTIG